MASQLLLTELIAKYEPRPRFDHVSQSVGSKVLVQGGRTNDFSEKSRQHLTSVVETFDPYSELWEQKQVEGVTPSPGTYAVASASLHDDLFTFGGWDGRNRFNTLHKLDSKTWRWSRLSPQNAEGAPMPKWGCGMISFGDILGVFGGYGIPREPTEPQSFIRDARFADGSGWTNEFNIYNLKEGLFILTLFLNFCYIIIHLAQSKCMAVIHACMHAYNCYYEQVQYCLQIPLIIITYIQE